MFTNITTKTIALGGISGLFMIGGAMGVEITKATLFEIRKSIASIEESKAANKAAEAQALDAINKLKAAIETATAMNNVGQLQANATIVAANQMSKAMRDAAIAQARGLVDSTTINAHPDNEMYDSITGPLFGEPNKKIAELNAKIVRLKHQQEQPSLIPFNHSAEIARLEEEKAILQETSAKNIGDAINMVMNATDGIFAGMGSLYPSASNSRTPPQKIIVQER
jgi:hypothetical protein